jgi:tetratricopeptide (TPR) repeat protein
MRKGSAKAAFASIVKVWAAERATALKRISARKGAKGRRKKREKDKDEGYGRPRDKRTTYAKEKARNTESKRRSRAKCPPMNAFDKLYLDVVAAKQQVEKIRGEFQRANNLVDQGLLYRSQGRYKDSTAMANEFAAMLSEAYRNLQIFRQQSRRLTRRGGGARTWWRGVQPEEDHPDIATGLHNLAAVYASSTTWHDKAESMHVEALSMRRRVHFIFRGPGGGTRDEIDHPDIAQSLSDLADLYEKQGRYDEAKPLYVKALAMRRRVHGAERDHPDIVTSLNSLAGLYKTHKTQSLQVAIRLRKHRSGTGLDWVDEAELLYVEALEMNRRMHGAEKDHPDIATSLNNLARLYVSKGRRNATFYLHGALEVLDAKAIVDADPSNKAAVDAYAAYVGSDAAKAAVDLANKAVADGSGGGSPWCSPAVEAACEPAREVFTDNWDNWDNDAWDNWDHAVSIIDYYYGRGDKWQATCDALLSVFYDKAEPLYVEALAMWRRVHGAKKDHPDIVASLAGRDIACKNLAGLYMAQRRYDEAEPLYVEAMEITRRVRGAEKAQSDTAQSLNNLAKRYMTGGRKASAWDEFRSSMKGTGMSQVEMATLYHDSKDATPAQTQADEERARVAAVEEQDRYAKAEPLMVEALAIRRRVHGAENIVESKKLSNLDIMFSLITLVELYDLQGRYDEAELMLGEVQAMEDEPLYRSMTEEVYTKEEDHLSRECSHLSRECSAEYFKKLKMGTPRAEVRQGRWRRRETRERRERGVER